MSIEASVVEKNSGQNRKYSTNVLSLRMEDFVVFGYGRITHIAHKSELKPENPDLTLLTSLSTSLCSKSELWAQPKIQLTLLTSLSTSLSSKSKLTHLSSTQKPTAHSSLSQHPQPPNQKNDTISCEFLQFICRYFCYFVVCIVCMECAWPVCPTLILRLRKLAYLCQFPKI